MNSVAYSLLTFALADRRVQLEEQGDRRFVGRHADEGRFRNRNVELVGDVGVQNGFKI